MQIKFNMVSACGILAQSLAEFCFHSGYRHKFASHVVRQRLAWCMLLCEGDCTATAEKGLDCRAQLYFYFSTSVSFGLFNFSHFELWRSPNTVAAAAQQQVNLPRKRTRVRKSKFMEWLMASEKKTKTCCIVDDQQRQVKRPDKSLLCQASEGILLDTRAACEIGNFNCEPRTRWTEQKCKNDACLGAWEAFTRFGLRSQ